MKLLEGMLILATEVWPKRLKLYLPSQTLFKAQRRRLLNRWLCSQGVGLAVGYPLAVAHQKHPVQSPQPQAGMLVAKYDHVEGTRGNAVTLYVSGISSWF